MNELNPSFHGIELDQSGTSKEPDMYQLIRESITDVPFAEGTGGARVYRFKKDSEQPSFWDNFIIRTRLDGKALRKALNYSTRLTSPQQIFSGFQASQPLLIASNTNGILFEILPYHEGESLLTARAESHLSAKAIFKDLQGPTPEQAQERLNQFFDQIAFIATQENTVGELEIHTKNIMLHNGQLSMIDCFPSETVRDEVPHSMDEKRATATEAVETLHDVLSAYFLELRDTSNRLSSDEDLGGWYNAMATMLHEAKAQSLQKLETLSQDHTVAESLGHTDWKGFQTVEKVSLGVSATVSHTEAALRPLYEHATDQHIGAVR